MITKPMLDEIKMVAERKLKSDCETMVLPTREVLGLIALARSEAVLREGMEHAAMVVAKARMDLRMTSKGEALLELDHLTQSLDKRLAQSAKLRGEM